MATVQLGRPLRVRRMSLCLPGYYGEMCRCAPVRCRWCRCEGQAWGMRGAVPPAAWAFAILLASDMLFLRRFPGEFAPFAFSQCVFY